MKRRAAATREVHIIVPPETAPEVASTFLTRLPDDCLRRCLYFSLNHTELVTVMRTCKRLQALVLDDEPWEYWCQHHFNLKVPRAPEAPLSTKLVDVSWLECAKRWHGLAQRVDPERRGLDGALYSRVLNCWRAIEDFYAVALPGVTATLNPGASFETFENLVHKVEGKREEGSSSDFDWRPLWYVYSVHDGQHLLYDEGVFENRHNNSAIGVDTLFNGLFGGYIVYNDVANSRLWPLKVVAKLRQGGDLPLAGNFNRRGRKVTLRYPAGGLNAVPMPSPGSLDVVIWLEEFARRLREGHYCVAKPHEAAPLCLVQFPQVPGALGCTRAVTRGIEVLASTVHMSAFEREGWSYSIRVRLLLPGEEGYLSPTERGFTTCQLHRRHWAICDPEQETSHVRGDGVIGKYPLLREGGYRDDEQDMTGRVRQGEEQQGTFIYQSCSGPVANHGSFGGELIMVPGSLQHPEGPPFEVVVARFPLEIPDYSY